MLPLAEGVLPRLLSRTTERPGTITWKHAASHQKQYRVEAALADSSTEVPPLLINVAQLFLTML